MAKYQQYEEYKNTGSKWVPEIPIHWEPILFKRVIDQIKDGTHGTHARVNEGFPFLSAKNVLHKGIEISDSESMISEKDYKEITANGFPKKDDLLITCVGTIGRTCVYEFDEPYAFQRSVAFLRLSELAVPKFYKYFVESKTYQSQLEANSKASAQSGVYMGDLVSTSTVLPPEDEQIKIANFLDHETAQIDTLIEKQQTLIQLLKEKRQAVISHAVTKGLNPDAPMKDSGVEWLGDVPEHWDLVPLKYLCNFSGGGTPTKDNLSYWTGGTIPWVSPKDMKSFWIDKTQDYITESAVKESSTKLIKAGSLLMVVRSGILQRTIPIAINTVDVTMNQDMRALQFNERMTSEYAANYIVGNVDKLLFAWSKEGATVESIEHEYLSNSLFPVPPVAEQQQIVDEINEQMKTFDSLVSKAQKAIHLMQERRTALISAAVTGKIDVRGWRAAE